MGLDIILHRNRLLQHLNLRFESSQILKLLEPDAPTDRIYIGPDLAVEFEILRFRFLEKHDKTFLEHIPCIIFRSIVMDHQMLDKAVVFPIDGLYRFLIVLRQCFQ